MAISDTQKVDLLYKKIAWSVAKTDTNPPKEAYNESTPSPLLIRGDTLWQLSGSIPASIPSTTSSIVQVYKDGSGSWSATIECTELAVTDNRTWSTGLTNWIDPEFGSTYFVKVYVDSSGSTTPQTTGTALQAAGVNDDQWYFDYQAGILNFIGTNLPTSIATGVTGKSVFISGARYVGPTGATSFPNGLTLGNITINGNTITGNTDITFGGNITTGNVLTNNLLYPNGVPFSFGSTYSNTNVASYLSSNTITGNITTQGNVTATYFYGSGAYLTGLSASYGNTNVATFLSHFGSNNIVTTGTFSGNIIADTITPYKTSSTVFNSTTAVGLPSGNTVQRPSSPAQGYTRYNTDTSTIEYWDGVAWVQVVNGVADQIITPDGTSSAYTLTQASSTIGVLVSINGTVQIPGVSYTVSGLTILFTETPLVTDIIDIRFLASAVSYNFPSNQSTYLNTVTASTAPTLLDTFPITGNATVNWVISANDTINTKYKSSTVSSLNDGTTVYYTESAILKTTTSNVAEFTSNITAGNINLWAVGDSANVAVTFERLVLGAATPAGYLTAGIYVNNPTINALVSGSKEFILTQDGNVTLPAGGMINYANGVSILTGITSGSGSTYSNTNVAAYLISGNITTGNILPQANITYSLGSASYQWQSLWVSGNTIYLGNTPLSISNGQLTVNGVPVGSTYSNANVVANLQNYVTSISTTANITTTANVIGTTFMFANGVNILSTVSSGSTYSNTNVAAYLSANTDSTISSLNANTAQQQIQITNINSNVTAANSAISTLQANVGSYYIWANANVAGLSSQITGANAAIVTANSAVVSYINTLNTAMASNVAGANAAIVTANTAMKVYVDAVSTAWTAANTIQSNQIAGANAAIVTANSAVVSYVNTLTNSLATGANANVAAYLTAGNISIGNVGYTVLPNTVTQFTSNVNSYGQINAQNINSGSAATTDIIVTANNGTDTVFFADLGIAGSAYNVNSPNNSLGNVIYANDTYLYAQGNTSANIGGNLAIGTSTANRTVKIFAGGINNTSTVATFSNTGIVATGNVTTLGKFVGDGSSLTNVTVSVAGNIQGTSSNVTLVAGNYNFVFDNTGTTTVGNINVTYNPTTTIGTGVVITAGNTIGGTGYADVIKITNNATGSTNPNKTFRLNSTGGLEIIDSTYSNNLFTLTNAGALTIKSTFTPGAYRVGEVIKTTMLYPGDMGISADVSITGGNIATYSYTPVSSSSYIIAEFGGRWEVTGTSIDSWWSNLYVASTQVGTGHMNWTTAGDGTLGRTGGFFPLAGRYTNTDTGIKAIYAQANRDTSDDNFIMRYTSGIGFWMKITEIGR